MAAWHCEHGLRQASWQGKANILIGTAMSALILLPLPSQAQLSAPMAFVLCVQPAQTFLSRPRHASLIGPTRGNGRGCLRIHHWFSSGLKGLPHGASCNVLPTSTLESKHTSRWHPWDTLFWLTLPDLPLIFVAFIALALAATGDAVMPALQASAPSVLRCLTVLTCIVVAGLQDDGRSVHADAAGSGAQFSARVSRWYTKPQFTDVACLPRSDRSCNRYVCAANSSVWWGFASMRLFATCQHV